MTTEPSLFDSYHPRHGFGGALLAVRIAGGMAVEAMGKTGRALQALRKKLERPSMQRFVENLRVMASVSAAEARQRFAVRAVGLLGDAVGRDLPGAAWFVRWAEERGLEPHEALAEKAYQLVRRVGRAKPPTPRASHPTSRRPLLRLLPSSREIEDRLGLRFALKVRGELITATGFVVAAERVEQGLPALPELPPVAPKPRRRRAKRVVASAAPSAAEAPVPLGDWRDDVVEYGGQRVRLGDIPEMRPDFVFGPDHWLGDPSWVPGWVRPRPPDDPFAPAPPPPPAPPTPEDIAAALPWLDAAIEYRLHHRPPAYLMPLQRRQMLSVAQHRWPTEYDLAVAIRERKWWPPPAGWRWHPDHAPRTIPKDYEPA